MAQRLTTEVIVSTAVAIADEQGLDAVSMRRIADQLGVGAMSLYRHIADKDALVMAMTNEIAAANSYPTPDPSWTWRDRVQVAADVDLAMYQQHPWVLFTFAAPRYSFGPYELSCLEWLTDGFRELGVDTRECARMALSVWTFVSGVALGEVSDRLLAHHHSDTSPVSSGLRRLVDGAQVNVSIPAGLSDLVGSGDADDLVSARAILRAGLTALCDGFEQAVRPNNFAG